MEYLLSTTHLATEGHTELAKTLEQTPVTDCDTLRGLANRAIAEYFKNDRKQNSEVQNRVRVVAQQIIDATSIVYQNLIDENSDEISNPDDLFQMESLSVYDENQDRLVDDALKDILESIEPITKVEQGNLSIYLFRIATTDINVNLVPEVIRNDFYNDNLGWINPRRVTYDMHFAGYDVQRDEESVVDKEQDTNNLEQQ